MKLCSSPRRDVEHLHQVRGDGKGLVDCVTIGGSLNLTFLTCKMPEGGEKKEKKHIKIGTKIGLGGFSSLHIFWVNLPSGLRMYFPLLSK